MMKSDPSHRRVVPVARHRTEPPSARSRPGSALRAGRAALLLVSALALVPTQPATAAGNLSRTTFPTLDDAGAPTYARIEPTAPYVYHDGEWAAITFYRDPACVPGSFNLLLVFDPSAFGCSMTIHGTHFWEGEPFEVVPPFMATFHGDGAVPVWFVPVTVIEPAIADGVLTIGELASLDGLVVGHADRFHERIHPLPLDDQGGNPNPKLSLGAHGQTEDGHRFDLHITSVDGDITTVQIHLRNPAAHTPRRTGP